LKINQKIGVVGRRSVGKGAFAVKYTGKVFIDEYIPTFQSY